jgi:hypothetical protein
MLLGIWGRRGVEGYIRDGWGEELEGPCAIEKNRTHVREVLRRVRVTCMLFVGVLSRWNKME